MAHGVTLASLVTLSDLEASAHTSLLANLKPPRIPAQSIMSHDMLRPSPQIDLASWTTLTAPYSRHAELQPTTTEITGHPTDPRFEQLRSAAHQGDRDALYELAVWYLEGTQIPSNYERAFRLFTKAAELGHISALNNVGLCYSKGLGVAQSDTIAAEYFLKAAEKNEPMAQLNLGACYEHGRGTDKNLVKAAEWYEKSALQGNDIAQYNLGMLLLIGEGLESNPAKAAHMFQLAAQKETPKRSRIWECATWRALEQHKITRGLRTIHSSR